MFDERDALDRAIDVGLLSPCAKSRRGVVIFHREEGVVAVGCNHPPQPFACDGSAGCREHCGKVCVHAESAALHDLRRRSPIAQGPLEMLHVKVVGHEGVPSGSPSCWQCSREVLEAGIATFWLLHEDGLHAYSAEDFHAATLRHHGLPLIRG